MYSMYAELVFLGGGIPWSSRVFHQLDRLTPSSQLFSFFPILWTWANSHHISISGETKRQKFRIFSKASYLFLPETKKKEKGGKGGKSVSFSIIPSLLIRSYQACDTYDARTVQYRHHLSTNNVVLSA